MKKIMPFAAAVLVVVTTGPALADKSVKAPSPAACCQWNGFYFGANLGYGATADTADIIYSGIFAGNQFEVNRDHGFDAHGVLGGVQLGYNFQQGRFVWGVEADFQLAGIDDKFSRLAVPPALIAGDTFVGRMGVNNVATVRGRLGYTFDHTLVYFTGGFALADIDQRIDNTSPGNPEVFRKKEGVRTGNVIGGGVEHKINSAWSIKAEYQYIDLGSDKLTGEVIGEPVIAVTNDIENSFHVGRIGINYHFR